MRSSMLRGWLTAVLWIVLGTSALGHASEAKQDPASGQKADDARAAASKPTTDPAQQTDPTLEPSWLSGLQWRSIGPASMGGRIIDLAIVESDPSTYYAVTATGGLFKTVNNGTTFEALFQHESTISIGDCCIAPSSPDVIWIGTGEHNARNSVSWGDGVYRSTDGGKSWKNMGLKETYQIGRIAIDPHNPYVVYVGALGRLWGENQERGLYKSIDGGETWDKILYVDEKTGCIDVQLCPDDPDTIIAAMYERKRDEFDVGDPAKRWGPGSGLYKSTDGGKNWKKLTEGLPTVNMGRIGIDYYRKDPKIVYAIIETEKIGTGPKKAEGAPAYMGINGEDGGGAKLTRVTNDGPADKAGLKTGDVIQAIGDEAIESYADLVAQIGKRKAGDTVKVKALRDDKTVEVELTFAARTGGSNLPFGASLGGQQENVQDKQGEEGFQTGGVFKSTDGGESWTRINSLNPRPFYYSQIRVDPSDDRYLYVLGISMYRSDDGGQTFRNDAGRGIHADHHALWIDPRDGRHLILGSDGGLYVSYDRTRNWDFHSIMAIGQFYHVAVDTRRPYRVYGGLQDNGSWGGPTAMRGPSGPDNSDWVVIGSGDGFVCQVDPNDPDLIYYESQYGRMGRVHLTSGDRASIRPPEIRGKTYRFNWKTPFLLSSHNSRIFYAAGNYVFRSLDQGRNLKIISPEITRTRRGSATALAESPVNSDVLYVGTDDGYLWATRDGGHNWKNITQRVKELEGPRGVSTIEASRFEEGRVYVVFDGHRNDDNEPHVLVSEDFGETWKSLRANLPTGSARVLREDVSNPNLLYLGTEFAIWTTVNRGREWIKLNNNLPTVAIHEIAVHPTAGEIVAATHGRSLWVLDVMPLRQMTPEVLAAKAFLFEPPATVIWASGLTRRFSGHKRFLGENPNSGAGIYFTLTEKAEKLSLKIVDRHGKAVRELEPKNEPGLHQVVWDVRRAPERRGNAPRSGSSGSSGRPTAGPRAEPGLYQVVLSVNGDEYRRDLVVEADPEFPAALTAEEDVQYDKQSDAY